MGPHGHRNRLYKWRKWGVGLDEKRGWLQGKRVGHLCAQPVRDGSIARVGEDRPCSPGQPLPGGRKTSTSRGWRGRLPTHSEARADGDRQIAFEDYV